MQPHPRAARAPLRGGPARSAASAVDARHMLRASRLAAHWRSAGPFQAARVRAQVGTPEWVYRWRTEAEHAMAAKGRPGMSDQQARRGRRCMRGSCRVANAAPAMQRTVAGAAPRACACLEEPSRALSACAWGAAACVQSPDMPTAHAQRQRRCCVPVHPG